MKVYDVLLESEKKTDEGPVRFLKRTLGKNTAMGKAAQLDVEIDKEVNSLFKDYYAVSKQDPQKRGMTAAGLADFLVAKGFASDRKSVLAYIGGDMQGKRAVRKAAKKGAKVAGAAAGATVAGAKKGAAAVGKAAKAVKNKVKPEPTGMTPDPRQGELDLRNSIYAEALDAYMLEKDMKQAANTTLDKGVIKKVIKRFVQQGFQKQLGSRVSKSAYGDAPKDKAAAPKPDLKKVKADADALGYTLAKK